MRRSQLCNTRSRSACCPSERICRPGCRLPCCAPTRRKCCPPYSKKNPNRCTFLPAPALTTRRYCGDPCSPPPPACRPKPCHLRKPRPSTCREPCTRPRAVSSPRCYSRPLRPYFSDLFGCTDPCRPKKCRPSPFDPCAPRLSDRCAPCRVSDVCYPSLCTTPPRYYTVGSCNKPRLTRRRASSRCRRRRSRSSQSSTCGSSYCESSYSRRNWTPRSFLRCHVCNCDPCCCNREEKCGSQAAVKCPSNTDTSKGPTSWFLKKSEKCGRNTSPTEPHFCPWEAEVTVTGTVRGHCTSTAVEVAKRLTGKFSSRGQRYTCKKEASAETSKCKTSTGPQRMTMGYLDDGTKLDFSRNRCQEHEEEACGDTKTCIMGRTNNASTDATASRKRWGKCRDLFENKERKHPGRERMTFATAVIGGNPQERKHEQAKQDERQPLAGYSQNDEQYSRFHHHHPSSYFSGHEQCKRHSRRHHRPRVEESYTDQSLYETAPETIREKSVQSYRSHHPYCVQDAHNLGYARHKGRRKTAEVYFDNSQPLDNFSSNSRHEWRLQNHHSNSKDEWYARMDGVHDVISFDLVNNDDCDNASDNNDIDTVNPHHFPPRQSIENRRTRSSKRRYFYPISYNRRNNTESRARHTRRRDHSQTNRSGNHTSHPSCLDLDADSGLSSEGELERGRSSHAMVPRTFDTQKEESKRESRHLHHRKKVTYGDALCKDIRTLSLS